MTRISRDEFDSHDCKESQDDGCQVCLAFWNQQQDDIDRRTDQYIEDQAFERSE